MPSQTSHLWQSLNASVLIRYILLFICGWITVFLVNYFYGTIAFFTVAGIFAALLNYPVVWLKRYIPRGWAITLVFLGAIAICIALVTLLGLQFLNQGQSLAERLVDVVRQQEALPFEELLNQLEIRRAVETLQSGLIAGLGLARSVFASIFTFIFGAVISLYMLIDGEKLWQASLRLIPVKSRDRFASSFQQSFLGFIRGQMLLMLFLSSTTLVAFPLLGVKYPLFLAILVGLIDAIPGIGATLGITVAVLLIFLAQGVGTALAALAVCIVLVQIQDNYVRPKVMKDALELNPVMLFLALFIGQRVAGLLGIFLSIPIAGMIAAWMRASQQEANPPEESPQISHETPPQTP
jgi:predicted PurR-regulated permease PerM